MCEPWRVRRTNTRMYVTSKNIHLTWANQKLTYQHRFNLTGVRVNTDPISQYTCRRPDSNRHGFHHHPLKMACLPVPPLRQLLLLRLRTFRFWNISFYCSFSLLLFFHLGHSIFNFFYLFFFSRNSRHN